MKKYIILISIFVFIYCIANKPENSNKLSHFVSDTHSIYAIAHYKNGSKIKKLYPEKIESLRLPPSKSLKRYLEFSQGELILLSDNSIFIFTKDLNLIRTLTLPESKSDYSIEKISKSDKAFVISDNYKNMFLYRDSKLVQLKNEIIIENFKIELIDHVFFINGNQTQIKLNSFSELIHDFFVLNENLIMVGNTLFNKSGKKILTLPISFYVYDALSFNKNFLLMATGKIIILGENCKILNELEANGPKILGKYKKNRIIIKLDNHRIATLNTETKEIESYQLSNNKIDSIAFVENNLFYVLSNDRTKLNKNDIDCILNSEIKEKDL
jgi:hypothetical protein